MTRRAVTVIAVLLSVGASAEESGHGAGHHAHDNLIAGFVGITGQDRRERALTFGVDYNRWISPSIGIGIAIERALGDLDFTVVALPVSYRRGHWKFFAGPGWEYSDYYDDNIFLGRVGVEYAFEKDGYEVAPKFMLDVIDGDVVVVGGVAIGLGF